MNKTLLLALIVAATTTSSAVFAAGFQLKEHSTSGLGRAFAGEAAIGDDASAGNSNPALLTRFRQPTISGGGILITPYVDINGTSQSGKSLDAENIAPNELVPNMHFIYPINDRLTVGSSLTSNFGLSTEFDPNYPAGQIAGKTELLTGNVNFSAGYKLTDALSFGAGINAVYAKAKVIRYAGEDGPKMGLKPSSELAHLKGEKWGYGWNVGLLYEFNDNNRIGLTYRSKVDIDFKGDFKNDLPKALPKPIGTGAEYISGQLSLKLPEIWELSGYHKLTNHWAFHYSAMLIGWDRFTELRATRSSDGAELFQKDEKFSNGYRLGVGTTYYYDDNWTFRSGFAFDKRVSRNAPSISIPDQDRYWFSLGTTYNFDQDMSVDLGFAYMLGKSVSFKEDTRTQSYDFEAKGKALFYGINFNYTF